MTDPKLTSIKKYSLTSIKFWCIMLNIAGVAELVDAADLKSAEVFPRAGSSPALGTKSNSSFQLDAYICKL